VNFLDAIKAYCGSVQWEVMITVSFKIVIILFVTIVVSTVIRRLIKRLRLRLTSRSGEQGDTSMETVKRIDTITRLIKQGVTLALWIIVTLVVLDEIGLEIAPILAGAGIIGLAVGFGAQNLVRDVISGFFFIMENQVRVGDVAIVNGTGGLVEEINFRTIVLRDLSGVIHVFPNGTISTLSNMTKGWSGYVFDLGVAYKEDTDKVVDIISQVGEKMKADPAFGELMLDIPEIFGVDRFDDSAVVIKGRIKTIPIQQWAVGREFLRRIKYAFDAQGVEIPFPHSTLYFGDASKPFDLRVIEGLKPDRTAKG